MTDDIIFGFDYGICCTSCKTKRNYDEIIDIGACENYFVNRQCRKCGQKWILSMTKQMYELMKRLEEKIE